MDTLVYLGGQLLIYGPIISGLLFYAAIKQKTEDRFQRALKFTLIGTLGFFLISTLNAHVEANWTVILLIPLIVLSFKYISKSEKLISWAKRLALMSTIGFLFLRIVLMTELLPDELVSKSEFHGWKTWAEKIQEKAGNRPVIFMNSYQKAAKYSFYTRKIGFSLNNIRYRRNQFDLWPIEDDLQGKEVFLIPNWLVDNLDTIHTTKEIKSVTILPNFRSYSKVHIRTSLENNGIFESNSIVPVQLTLSNGYNNPIHFDENKALPITLIAGIFYHEDYLGEQFIADLTSLVLDQEEVVSYQMEMPIKPGIYYLRFSLKSGWLPPMVNSDLIRIRIS